jgi:hypothetical protein
MPKPVWTDSPVPNAMRSCFRSYGKNERNSSAGERGFPRERNRRRQDRDKSPVRTSTAAPTL